MIHNWQGDWFDWLLNYEREAEVDQESKKEARMLQATTFRVNCIQTRPLPHAFTRMCIYMHGTAYHKTNSKFALWLTDNDCLYCIIKRELVQISLSNLEINTWYSYWINFFLLQRTILVGIKLFLFKVICLVQKPGSSCIFIPIVNEFYIIF